ncbi:Zn2 DNA-binding protein [Venustampulla echinocandica]|uniref:Zn2 DNA-binding protein n=1 Tax=Venustampulla echinocandica TaxID=2656787 RepID=A0A370TX51_9HELO|nr:Zn2 DNA-binding protein [Venustampulla echinocandica]RDL40106.1 Zn2 DNA-binding protein [Venustampulla echinocandica]
MDQQVKPKKPGKARIPDHLRRRALVSCDRCKKRRIRCTRSGGTDAQEACSNCLEVGAKCESTLPRKTRIYGSVETLSVRFRVLDALIKGLFPSNDTNNIDELYAIAEAHDITLPTFNEQIVAAEVFNHPPPKAATTSPQPSASPSAGSIESESRGIQETAVSKVTEEKLVPTPHGPSHYIGPSSSFGFVLTVRNMVAEFNAALKTIQPDDERSKISSDFAGSTWSKALDPINKEESDESSDGTVDRAIPEHGAAVAPNNHRYRPPYRGGSSSTSASVSSRSKRATVLSLLPSKEITDRFIAAYFDQVHPNYLLFHRPSFQNRYELVWVQPQQMMRDVEPGLMCCIFMMIVFGAQVLENEDHPQAKQIQRHYLDLVQSRMHQLVSATTLINVQALLLLQLYQHNCTERNSAFMLLGCASRMAMALGMHREGTSGGFDRLEREVRKRVWWTAYAFEQYQCAILGRPCAIDDAEVNITFPDEMMLDGGESVPYGYVDHSIRLAKLLSEVRRKIYVSPSQPTEQGDTPKTTVIIQFLRDLDTWHHGLPPTLRLEYNSSTPKHRRAVILLHIQFHHVQSLVTRPFILRKVGVQLARQLGKHVRSQDLDKEEMALSNACGIFSRKSALLIQQLLSTGTFDGRTWLDAYYIYHSVFILSLDFLARPWTEKDNEEDLARKAAVRDVMNALENIKLCPTFSILTQVALQLAKIVGIFDVRSEPQEKAEQFREYMEQQQATFAFDYNYANPQPASGNIGANGNIANAWFQKAPVDIPWELKDFFGVENFVGVGEPNFAPQQTFGVGYSALPPPPATRGEIIATSPAPPAYTHWGPIDTRFIQQPRNDQMPDSHKGHPGMMGQAP